MSSVAQQYKKQNVRLLIVELAMVVLCVALFFVSLTVGSAKLSLREIFGGLFGTADKFSVAIMQKIRLPRTLAALIAGFGLSIAGFVMQSVLDNPMASPSTLGVSNAAVFGANFAIVVLGAGTVSYSQGVAVLVNDPYVVILTALIFSIASVFLITFLSASRGFAIETVVLAGLAMGSMFTAGTTLVQYFATDTELSYAVYWAFGDLGRADITQDIIMLVVVAISFAVFIIFGWDFSAISMGDDVAKSLGVKVKQVRAISLIFASLICAVVVSFLGIIGFIGLIAPHVIKRLVKASKRHLLILSGLAGVIILTVSDILCRLVLKGQNLPVGAVTSLFGAPLFMIMLFSSKKSED